MKRRKDTIAYTVDEAAEATSIGRDRIIDALHVGELVAYYIGRKAIILQDELTAWIRTLPQVPNR